MPGTIWIDADACPAVIKEILFRAAERRQVLVQLVANQPLRVPRSAYIRARVVPGGFDVADMEIVRCVQKGDLVVTADIPLAAKVLEKGAQALNPRGEIYSSDTIAERVRLRDFMEQLRETGVQTGGPAPLGQAARQAFANALDRILAHWPQV